MMDITIRNVPPILKRALRDEQRRRGKTLSQTVIEILEAALGLRPDTPRSNGLARLAGGWSEEEFHRFQSAIGDTERIDPKLWR